MDECIPCHVRRKHKPKPYTIFSKPRGERGRLLFLSAPRFFFVQPKWWWMQKQKPKSVGAQMCSNKRGEEVAIFDSSIKLEPLKRSCVSLPIIILLSTFWDVFQEFVLWVANFFVLFKLVHGKLWVIGVFLRWIRLTQDRVKQFYYSLANFCCHGNLTPTCFVNFTMATVLRPWWKSIILQSLFRVFWVYFAIRLNHFQSEKHFISAPIDFS